MVTISGTDGWRTAHPGAMIGLLELDGVDNTLPGPLLDREKREAEARLRREYAGFSRQDFLSLPVIGAYARYYRRFDKTYHVLLQVESVVLKGKDLPAVSPLVDANFLAEVNTGVLAAGHDVDRLHEPVVIDVSQEGDRMTLMNGEARTVRAGDMVMRDAQGVSCSILYGQDNRSPITRETRHVLYVSYVPAGVPEQAVETHLRLIEQYLRLSVPEAHLEQCRVLKA